MTIQEFTNINTLLNQRENIDHYISSLKKSYRIDISAPAGSSSLHLDHLRKSDKEMFDAMIGSAIEIWNKKRDEITLQLKELGLEE